MQSLVIPLFAGRGAGELSARNLKWLQQRDEKVRKEQFQKEEEELKDCTFTPTLCARAPPRPPTHTAGWSCPPPLPEVAQWRSADHPLSLCPSHCVRRRGRYAKTREREERLRVGRTREQEFERLHSTRLEVGQTRPP